MPPFDQNELALRDNIAYQLLTEPYQRPDIASPDALLQAGIPGRPPHLPPIDFPTGLDPRPQPEPQAPAPTAPLEQADVVVITYTQAEAAALSDVLTPGTDWTDWYAYSRNYAQEYRPLVGPHGPSLKNGRLGSFYVTQIDGKKVLVMKSELHLATDKQVLPNGDISLPIRKFFTQIIAEAKPGYFLTTGTAGGVSCKNNLGDVAVTRAGLCHFDGMFKDVDYNGKTFSNLWDIPRSQSAAAVAVMRGFASQLDESRTPPNDHCGCGTPGALNILYDGDGGIASLFPVITTDTFEYGSSTNGLGDLGMAVEMDDAILGMVCAQDVSDPPKWASVRNLSDPCINGDLSSTEQIRCATTIYQKYGYWTSVMSAMAIWSIIAGL
jgi:hypothetical protein